MWAVPVAQYSSPIFCEVPDFSSNGLSGLNSKSVANPNSVRHQCRRQSLGSSGSRFTVHGSRFEIHRLESQSKLSIVWAKQSKGLFGTDRGGIYTGLERITQLLWKYGIIRAIYFTWFVQTDGFGMYSIIGVHSGLLVNGWGWWVDSR